MKHFAGVLLAATASLAQTPAVEIHNTLDQYCLAQIRQMMKDRGLAIPAEITSSIWLARGVNGCQ